MHYFLNKHVQMGKTQANDNTDVEFREKNISSTSHNKRSANTFFMYYVDTKK